MNMNTKDDEKTNNKESIIKLLNIIKKIMLIQIYK